MEGGRGIGQSTAFVTEEGASLSPAPHSTCALSLSLAADRGAPPTTAAMTTTQAKSNGRQDDDGIGSSDDETVSSTDTAKAEEDGEAAEDADDDDSTASPFEADSSPNAVGRRKVRMD